jgi:hypothetical protein
MQKVEGSSPFIRFNKAPLRRGFRLHNDTKKGICNRYCNRPL